MITAGNKYGHSNGQGEKTDEKKNKGMSLCNFYYYFWRSFSMSCYEPFLGQLF